MAEINAGGGSAGATTIRAIALVGFFHGEPLVEPGTILELTPLEFGELKAFNLVDYAPADTGEEDAEIEAEFKAASETEGEAVEGAPKKRGPGRPRKVVT